MIWPIQGRITQRFGENPQVYRPFGYLGHEGLDISAATGTPVRAMHDGVIDRGYDGGGYGLYATVSSSTLRTLYGHLSEVVVEGPVRAGQVIALSGNTGKSTGPHLHISIRPIPHKENGYKGNVDPLPYLQEPGIFPHINDVREGMLEYLAPFAGIKLLIKDTWLRQFRERHPDKVVIGRWHYDVGQQEALLNTERAADEMEARICKDPCFQLCDYIEGLNEIGGYPYRPNAGHENILRLLRLERAFSERVRAHGKKYLGGSWSTGNPDMQWLDDDEFRNTVIHHYDGVSLHEYYAPLMQSPGHEGNTFRHHEWFTRFPDKPLYITECGCDSLATNPHLTPTHKGYFGLGVSARQAAEDLRWYRSKARAYGISPYCTGVIDPQWDTFDWWKHARKELADMTTEQEQVSGQTFTNGDFEGGFRFVDNIPELQVANGWEPFWASPPAKWYGDEQEHYDFRPEYKRCGDETTGPKRSLAGYGQQWFTTYAGHRGGIYQRISTTPGQKITLTARMMSWHTQVPHRPEVSTDQHWIPQSFYCKKVGLDTAGGNDPFSPSITWSEESWDNDRWITLSVTAIAQGNVATLFLYGAPKYSFHMNNCYVDNVSLNDRWLPSTDTLIQEAIASNNLQEMQTKIRWCVEEATRIMEAGDAAYALDILQDLVRYDGLLYKAENTA